MNGKFVIILVGLVLAALAVMMLMKNKSVENFVNVPRTVQVHSHMSLPDGRKHAVSGHPQLYDPSVNMYQVPGTFQANLEPRMNGGVGVGPHIRYNPPCNKNLAVPEDPLSRANMVENYEGFPPKCGSGGQTQNVQPVPDHHQVAQDALHDSYMETAADLPVHDLNMIQQSDGTEAPGVIVHNRHIYANQKSHLNALGDPIRGDLVPCPDPHAGNIFQVPKNQNHLRKGALGILAGNNESHSHMLNHKNLATGGHENHEQHGLNLGMQYGEHVDLNTLDVAVSAFP